MIYKRKNGNSSFFKNSYQEIATYAVIGAFSCQLAITGVEKLILNGSDIIWNFLIVQFIIYCIFYIKKFKKYYNLVD